MKQLIIISILSFFFAGSSFGQKFEPMDSLNLDKFDSYVNSVLAQKKDSIIPSSLPGKYSFIYKTRCPFTEYIWGAIGSDDVSHNTSGKSFNISGSSGILSNTNKIYLCAEYPLEFKKSEEFVSIAKDSTSKTENYITTKIILNFNTQDSENSVFSKGVSYCNGKYFIIEWSLITTIGNQISDGFTETLYLERIE